MYPSCPNTWNYSDIATEAKRELAVDPGWFQIWPVDQVAQYNQEYSFKEFLPGFFGIGSSGGGELLAFDMRAVPPWPVVAVPFIPLSEAEAIQVAPNFMTFVSYLGVPCQ